jgi:Domain of unknown function (DUF5666)
MDDSSAGDGSVVESAPAGRLGRRGHLRVASAAVFALGLGLETGSAAAAASSNGQSEPGTTKPSGPPPQMSSPPTATGTVTMVGDESFTLTTSKQSTVVVKVSDATTYRDRKVTSASFSDLAVGQRVAVFGTVSSGVVQATSVNIGAPPRGPAGRGAGPRGPRSSPPAA